MNNFTRNSYYAHSGTEATDKADWQSLSEHLHNVAVLAAKNASFFGGETLAQMAGLLHDLGKYSPAFQRRLEGAKERVDHATAGAKIAVDQWGLLGRLLAFVIAGHHAGLANGVDEGVDVGHGRRTLKARLAMEFGVKKNGLEELDPVWKTEIDLPQQLPALAIACVPSSMGFQLAFFTRMLYSCLVDADFIDTDNFYRKLRGKAPRSVQPPRLTDLQGALQVYLQTLQAKAQAKNPGMLNTLRQEILQSAVDCAAKPSGLFTLTVPTGGGKTLVSMAFALEHALKHQKRRVIYVIPFTSIIEQNAKVFREAFGEYGRDAVLEHHSAFEEKAIPSKDSRDKLKLAMENWEAPVVVTTAVQFFESLFADRSSKCRKLHNIAGSVIILDEAQTLPLKLLLPVMEAIKELARNYGCTVVLCTATQPALLKEHGFYNGFEDVLEIAPDPPYVYKALQRVNVKHIGVQSDTELQQHLSQNEQILLIVNNRRHARSLYEGMVAQGLSGVRHLTTLMCAKHRSQVLDGVRADLLAGQPCRLVATSLIEAGVDVDFPVVYRAEAGLDSIAQAAGRCNREGRRSVEDSGVYIFQTNKTEWKTPPELEQLAGSMREVVRKHSADLLAPEAITSYFQSVYWLKGAELDKHKILPTLQAYKDSLDFPFQNLARDFCMIESHLVPVIIPYDLRAQRLIRALWLPKLKKVGGIARKLQPYLVQIPQRGLEALRKAGRIELIAPEKFGEQFWCLIGLELYDKQSGLSWDNPVFVSAESCVM